MAVRVRLDCPLCGTIVVDGDEPEPGTCPGCAATYVGGTDRPDGAVSAALRAAGNPTDDVSAATLRLFDDEPRFGVAITSDHREGFYRWWVFIADTDAARQALAELAQPRTTEA